MFNETWRFEPSPLRASRLEIFKSLDSYEQTVIQGMLEQLGQRLLFWHHAQGFQKSAMVNFYLKGKKKYIGNVKRIPRQQVYRDANIVASHEVYRISIDDDDSLKLKASIALHGKKIQKLRTSLRTAVCAPQLISM